MPCGMKTLFKAFTLDSLAIKLDFLVTIREWLDTLDSQNTNELLPL